MVEPPIFDVFLAHNSKDKPQIRRIASKLKEEGLNPWLDEEQIPPGELFQEVIQRAIPQIKSAAICIGSEGLGKWQVMELRVFISQFIDKGSVVIPVLLPGVDSIPENLLFLRQINWVRFENIDDVNAFDRLKWGITGVKPDIFTSNSQFDSKSLVISSSQVSEFDVGTLDVSILREIQRWLNTPPWIIPIGKIVDELKPPGINIRMEIPPFKAEIESATLPFKT